MFLFIHYPFIAGSTASSASSSRSEAMSDVPSHPDQSVPQWDSLIATAKFLGVQDHPCFTLGIATQRYALLALAPDLLTATINDFNALKKNAQPRSTPFRPFSSLVPVYTPLARSTKEAPIGMDIFLDGKIRVCNENLREASRYDYPWNWRRWKVMADLAKTILIHHSRNIVAVGAFFSFLLSIFFCWHRYF